MEVSNRQFINSHGKAPKGRGMWGFIFTAPSGPNSHDEAFWFCPVPGSFADARKAAKVEAKRRGNVDMIEVAP